MAQSLTALIERFPRIACNCGHGPHWVGQLCRTARAVWAGHTGGGQVGRQHAGAGQCRRSGGKRRSGGPRRASCGAGRSAHRPHHCFTAAYWAGGKLAERLLGESEAQRKAREQVAQTVQIYREFNALQQRLTQLGAPVQWNRCGKNQTGGAGRSCQLPAESAGCAGLRQWRPRSCSSNWATSACGWRNYRRIWRRPKLRNRNGWPRNPARPHWQTRAAGAAAQVGDGGGAE